MVTPNFLFEELYSSGLRNIETTNLATVRLTSDRVTRNNQYNFFYPHSKSKARLIIFTCECMVFGISRTDLLSFWLLI